MDFDGTNKLWFIKTSKHNSDNFYLNLGFGGFDDIKVDIKLNLDEAKKLKKQLNDAIKLSKKLKD